MNEDRFLPSFKRSMSYVKLLAELDLLKEEDSKSLDGISLSSMRDDVESMDELGMGNDQTKSNSNSSASLTSLGRESGTKEGYDDTDDGCLKGVFESRVCEAKDATFYLEGQEQIIKLEDSGCDQNAIRKLQQGRFDITAEIIETGVVSDRGKTYGIYAVAVSKGYESGYKEQWHIYRRYSDFHDLHQKIKEKYYDLAKLPFPAKKAFHNMERTVLERRMAMLNAWLNRLTKPAITDGHMGLQNLLLGFLEQGDYDKGVTGGHISKTVSFDILKVIR